MRVHIIVKALMAACVISSNCVADGLESPWKTDIEHQVLAARPRLEACYTDATRTALSVDAQAYRLVINMAKDGGQRVSSFMLNTTGKLCEVLSDSGMYLQMADASGNEYSSLLSKNKSRVNIYRRGPYYIEVHWLDVEMADKSGKPAPVKGEVVFYCYPEKVHVGAILHVTEDVAVRYAQVTTDFNAGGQQIQLGLPRVVRVSNGSVWSCAMLVPAPDGVDGTTLSMKNSQPEMCSYIYSDIRHAGAAANWVKGQKPAAYFELLPMGGRDSEDLLRSESSPIMSAGVRAYEGRYMGYDPIRGCYTVQTDSIGGFNEHFKNPNSYERANFALCNGEFARKVYVLHETRKNPGSVECGVVLDDQDYPLPITVQISKNFNCEVEEPFYNPNDTCFSETIFPLYLAPNERRAMTSLHLYQNWGTHMLKQFSSLGAWMDYYHMSTGVTETTCYVPFLFGGLDGVSIADFRGMSQRFWGSQPQHDNVAGHSFLRYLDADDKWHYVEYTGTEFRSTGPNWADMSMSYLSDDGKARVKIDVFEMPQADELRNFIHMRIDFLGDIKVKDGDIARNVRLLNAATWVQGMRYTSVAYGGANAEPAVVPIKFDDGFTLAGAPLPKQNSFAVIYPDSRGANAFVIRDSRGRIGGQDAALGVSVIGWNTQARRRNPGDTILMLVPATKATQIKAGDFIEADLFLMPYGGGTQTPEPVQKAVLDYGVNSPKVTDVTRGAKLADFPTRIALDREGRAEFGVKGGFDCIPIIVEGAKNYRYLRLYSLDGGKKTLIDHSQQDMNDGYQVFARPDGTFGSVFLFKTDGKEHRFVAE